MKRFKIVIVGDYAVGKTTLVLRFTERQFQEMYLPTIGVQFSIKELQYNDEKVEFVIWDIAGQEEFKSVRSEFYMESKAQILVYDITRKKTLDNLEMWYEDVIENAGEIPALILGNKSDLEDKRAINFDEAKSNIKSKKFKSIITVTETSAKSGKNVDKAFNKIAEVLLKK